jgi:invasion protein IalB
MKNLISFFFCFALVHFLPNFARAQESSLINSYEDWYVFVTKQDNASVCFLSSKATKSEGNYSKRGDVLFIVTHRPAKKEFGVINFQTGYIFKEDLNPVITIGNNNFSLFAHGSDGWAKNTQTDIAIVKAMINGSQMFINGISSRGTKTTDTFSLRGFTAAYKAASKACKI